MDVAQWARDFARATWWRSVLWYLACVSSSILAISAGEIRADVVAGRVPGEVLGNLWVLLMLFALVFALLVLLRYRWPWQITVVASVVALALPLDPLLVLIGLMHVWRACAWRTIALVTPLATAATFVATWRDTRGRTTDGSFWQFMVASGPEDPGTGEPMAWWVPVIITALVVTIFVGTGWFRRELSRTRATGETHRANAARLTDEVVRQSERERIAREVHDVIGHRLSLLSVHAGALEANTRSQDPRLAESATLVRESAASTATDLRSLLEVLRRPDDPGLAEAVPGMEALPALMDESVAHGMPLVATVLIDGADGLDETVGQAAYRITQELLTNARRHAPGVGVRLVVVARPAVGVSIEIANRGRQHAPVTEGGGLTGIRERAGHLGGECRVGMDDEGVFRVAVHLPWRVAARLEGR